MGKRKRNPNVDLSSPEKGTKIYQELNMHTESSIGLWWQAYVYTSKIEEIHKLRIRSFIVPIIHPYHSF